jgi:diguanylate cyclase
MQSPSEITGLVDNGFQIHKEPSDDLDTMAQTPNVIGIAVMQRLKEINAPATPENYERVFYELSGLPRPAAPASAPAPAPEVIPVIQAEAPESLASPCAELLQTVREMVQDVADKTNVLAQDLGTKNKDLADNVDSLKSSRDRQEILRLLSTVVLQAGGIQSSVESSHKELLETRYALINMQNELSETRQMLNEDPLTGALNRRGMEQTLSREIARAQRNDGKFAIAMVDLDFFKKINDQHGHEVGDQMLIHFSQLIRSVLRKSDALVRYGGEEFTLLLPDTDSRGAMLVLSRLQQLMKKSPIKIGDKEVNTTFSAGVAFLKPEENGHAVLRRADEALYRAKKEGRDRIVIAS